MQGLLMLLRGNVAMLLLFMIQEAIRSNLQSDKVGEDPLFRRSGQTTRRRHDAVRILELLLVWGLARASAFRKSCTPGLRCSPREETF